MSLTNRDDLVYSMGNDYVCQPVQKANVTSQIAGSYTSFWKVAGQPGAAGTIGPVAAICTNATPGALSFVNPTSPKQSYLFRLWFWAAAGNHELQLHDRLIHVGNFSAASNALQLTSIDVSTVSDRVGTTDYSDVQFWIEVQTVLGGSPADFTLAATYHDNTTGNIIVTPPVNSAPSCIFKVQSAVVGKYIKSIQSVQLSASMTGAGVFAIVATRQIGFTFIPGANYANKATWNDTGNARIYNNSCLFLISIPGTASTGEVRAQVKIGFK